jgi:uncharacterized protein with ParB-like and HNH nuclease domain
MAYVNPQTQSIKLCFQSHYSLPYFQREYKWEARHYTELVNDIQEAFMLNFDSSHSRKEVASYSPYFLGSIITSVERDGKKPLIDGQQRLTSVFLLLAYLERLRKENDIANALDLSTLLGSVSFGAMDYSIEFSASRKSVFNQFLDFNIPLKEAIQKAEEIPDLDKGDEKLLDALRATEEVLNTDILENMAYFIDYFVERVVLIDISVDTESEAHRVFVTMNDRGLRLGPIDLLKGEILSHIPDTQDAESCHRSWVDTINTLKSIDPEEDSLFFRNLFRSKWAETMRGKAKGDSPGDFDIIGEAYHRWFEDNTERLGIANADDYIRFARDDIPKYARIYSFIKSAESTLNAGYECIFYNAALKYSLQPMVLLASVNASDNTTEWQKKISLVSKLVNIILTSRVIEGRANNYDNLKELSFTLAKEARNKDYEGLLGNVRSQWPSYASSLLDLHKLKYSRSDRSDILYVLARIACYLENSLELTTRVGFATYWQRDRGMRTFDIEHLLKERFNPADLPQDHGFTDPIEYGDARNLIGALALLPRSRNRSLQAAAYRDKLAVYATENILVQALCSAFYQNNPTITRFTEDNPAICLSAIDDFSKAGITSRANVYAAIAQKVWAAP